MSPNATREKPSYQRIKLGELLLNNGLIDATMLATALDAQKRKKKKIGQIFVDLGFATDIDIAKALSDQLKIPFLRLHDMEIPAEVLSLLPAEVAHNYLLLPLKIVKKKLVVAMANPLEFYALDDLRFITQMPILMAVAPQSDIIDALVRFYPDQDLELNADLEMNIDTEVEIIQHEKEEEEDAHNLVSLTELPPVVRFTNSVMADAIRQGASDIHIEPQKAKVIIRYRVDGVMREIMQTNKHIHTSLVSRIKILSEMDISVRRQPQDGRTHVRIGKQQYDLRVATIPTSYGEKVTIRILNPETDVISVKDLGFSVEDYDRFKEVLSHPQGIVLVTGPTGSGKTSTLCACLKKLNTPLVNIVTVEDPIEYDIAGINQVQINPRAGMTFASGLRSILRQDPDIIMVGEIRDAETVQIAFQAAQTGHFVLSSLHTNDAPSAVTRLMDLGVDPFVVTDGLLAVLGQRLVRKICPQCKTEDRLGHKMLAKLPLPPDELTDDIALWKGAGCEGCQYTGYRGRLGIFELLTMGTELKTMLGHGISATSLRAAAEAGGYRSLYLDGVQKAIQGLTTIEEILRVAPPPIDHQTTKKSQRVQAPESADTDPDPGSVSIGITAVKPKKILIIEQDEVAYRLLHNALTAQNLLSLWINNGQEALKQVVLEKPDLIVCALELSDLSGVDLLKKIKANLNTRFIPVIVLAIDDRVETEVTVMKAGAEDYVTKPFHVERLIARIQRRLE